jgi:hypothetical protein
MLLDLSAFVVEPVGLFADSGVAFGIPGACCLTAICIMQFTLWFLLVAAMTEHAWN